jgi:hypothetical protein
MATGTSISNYLENKLLDHSLGTTTYTKPTTVYVSLHTADPGETGSGAEVTGGSYARQAAAFSAAASGVAANSGILTFASMPAVTVTHIAVWDAATSGNMLYYGPLTTSRTLSSGDSFAVAIGAFTVALD